MLFTTTRSIVSRSALVNDSAVSSSCVGSVAWSGLSRNFSTWRRLRKTAALDAVGRQERHDRAHVRRVLERVEGELERLALQEGPDLAGTFLGHAQRWAWPQKT